MRIVFSRKGFDGASGGCPSPILEDRPISLPIPTERRSTVSFEALGLGPLVERASRGRIDRSRLCHADPDLVHGAFGQTGAAQSHLERRGVGVGDVFLFFGLFAALDERLREMPHVLTVDPPRTSEDGATVLLTTQYLEEADALADEITVVDHGRVIARDTPSAVGVQS